MRFNQPWLSAEEFAQELDMHPRHVKDHILAVNKCRHFRATPQGRYKIRREWADEYMEKHTFGKAA